MPCDKLDFVLKNTPVGNYFYLPTDRYVGKSLDKYGVFSPEETNFFSLICPGRNVIEVGANMGALTLPIAKVAKQVWVYEPQDLLVKILQCLKIFNNLTNLNIEQAFVGSEAGEIFAPYLDYTIENNFGGFSKDICAMAPKDLEIQMSKVPVVTLDRLFPDQLHFIDLIKIDVEGMERDVILGAKALIARERPVLFVENDRPEKSQALVDELLSLNYDLFWHVTPLFTSQNPEGNQENIFEGLVSFNLICLPKNKQCWFRLAEGQFPICTSANPFPPALPYNHA